MGNLCNKVRAAIEAHGMFPPGALVVVGVSGGPDSVVLLHCLASLKPELGLRLHVAHLNHMLRGEEAARDAQYVAQLAQQWSLPANIEAVDVEMLCRQHGWSIEEAARRARYSFFADVVQRTGASCVAVGHTADDQVETVIMHWLRGTGTRGLRGMLPITRWPSPAGDGTLRIVRPLLDATRAEVEEYCRQHQLRPRLDRTNLEMSYRRNQIRHQLLPILESYNPRFRQAVLRSIRIATDDYDYLERQASELWGRVARLSEGHVIFGLRAWLALPRSLQRHLLREAVNRLRTDLADITAFHIEAAMDMLADGTTGKAIDWPGGLRVEKGYDDFRILVGPVLPNPLPADEQRLVVPGTTALEGTLWRVVAATAQTCPPRRTCRGSDEPGNPWHADLDYAVAGPCLVVRRRRPGDCFYPLGMHQRKKLHDFLIDAKVPRWRRDSIPLVCSPSQILWVAGQRIDDRAKVTEATRTVLCLRFVAEGVSNR